MDADEQTIPAAASAQTDCKTPRQKAGFLDSGSGEAGECRLPLVEPSEAHKEYIEKALRAEGLITE